MDKSFDDLYEEFCNVLDGDYTDDPGRQEAVIEATAAAVKAILDKLRNTDRIIKAMSRPGWPMR